MSSYSFSQIQTYLKCPFQYKLRYVDKIRPEFEQNLHLILWVTVHDSLDFLYKEINSFNFISKWELLDYFLEIFDKSSKNLDFKDTELEEFKNRWVVYLESFYDKNHPFKDIKLVWTETQLYIDLGDWIKYQWFIDRLDKQDRRFTVTDYKTNKFLPSWDDVFYQEQLTIYALGVVQKYGKYFDKIYWNIEYLHFETKDHWEITSEQMQSVQEKYKKLSMEIEKKKSENALWVEDSFPVKESALCRFCDYKELCPLFSQLYTEIEDSELSKQTVQHLIDEYIKLSYRKSEAEFEMKKIKESLQLYAQRHEIKRLHGTWWSIGLSNIKTYSVKDNEKLTEYLKNRDRLNDFLSLDRFKIARSIKDDSLSFVDIRDFVKENDSVVFRVRQNKKT